MNGLAFVGAGSEWFWSMLQFVIVTVTLVAIYRQVRLQSSTAAIEQIDRIVKDWNSEISARHALALEIALRNGTPRENLPYGAASFIGDFWEGIGYLVRQGHIDPHLVHENLGSNPQWWWAVLGPWARQVRIDTREPGALEHLEWLANEMAALDRERGEGNVYTEEFIASVLDNRIANLEERILIAERVRSVPVDRSRRSSGAARDIRER